MMNSKDRFHSAEAYEAYMAGYRDCESDFLDVMISAHKNITHEFVAAVDQHLTKTSHLRMRSGNKRLAQSFEELADAAENWEPEGNDAKS